MSKILNVEQIEYYFFIRKKQRDDTVNVGNSWHTFHSHARWLSYTAAFILHTYFVGPFEVVIID